MPASGGGSTSGWRARLYRRGPVAIGFALGLAAVGMLLVFRDGWPGETQALSRTSAGLPAINPTLVIRLQVPTLY